MKSGGDYLHKGLTRKTPPQRAAGDPKKPSKSLDMDAVRSGVAPTPKTLGPRTV